MMNDEDQAPLTEAKKILAKRLSATRPRGEPKPGELLEWCRVWMKIASAEVHGEGGAMPFPPPGVSTEAEMKAAYPKWRDEHHRHAQRRNNDFYHHGRWLVAWITRHHPNLDVTPVQRITDAVREWEAAGDVYMGPRLKMESVLESAWTVINTVMGGLKIDGEKVTWAKTVDPATATPKRTAGGGGGGKVLATDIDIEARTLNEPSSDAFKAYRAHKLLGKTQSDVATMLNTNQGQVSRWVGETAAWLKAGNIMPDMPTLAAKPISVDPAVIEMGAREDRRTRRQRNPSNADADDARD